MYEVKKRFEISASHRLELDYESKCKSLHGHNWVIEVVCKSCSLNNNGMVFDFTHIKRAIHDRLDHGNLNEILPCNPTAENIAKWIADEIGFSCVQVSVQEREGTIAIWRSDDY